MAIRAFPVAESVPNGLHSPSKPLLEVACGAPQISVGAVEGIGRQLGVREGLDLEGLGGVTSIAGTLRLGETKLPRMNVTMTARALGRGPTVGGAPTAQPIFLRRAVAALASGLGVRAREWPFAMVDARGVPSDVGVAVRASASTHLRSELITVRVLMTVGTSKCAELQTGPGTLPSMTARTRYRLMPTPEWKTRSRMLLYRKGRWPEAMLIVAARTIGLAKRPAMDITMTVAALVELELSVSPLQWELGRMAPLAGHVAVHPLEREARLRVCAKADGAWQLQPAYAGVTALTPITERRFVNLLMAGYASPARARRLHIASIVAVFALGLRVPPGEAQPRVVTADVADFGPVGLVVTGRALLALEPIFVGVGMTRGAALPEAEVGRISPTVRCVMAVLALHQAVGAVEWPPRHSVLESIPASAWPTDEFCISSEVLDMATAARLLSIFWPAMQPLSSSDARMQVVMAAKACVHVDSLSRGMALAAVHVTVDLGMCSGELSG